MTPTSQQLEHIRNFAAGLISVLMSSAENGSYVCINCSWSDVFQSLDFVKFVDIYSCVWILRQFNY